MKIVKDFITTVIGQCIRALELLFRKFSKCKHTTIEDTFLHEWTAVLTGNARTFNGLYNGLLRVHSGSVKKPEKVLREWIQRTHYKFENQPVDTLCQENIRPLIEAEDRVGLTKWANLLLNAATAAGITKEEATMLVLTESNADAYVEWDDNDLYPEDKIEIITPAWYQNGKVLEQGQCKVKNTEEE